MPMTLEAIYDAAMELSAEDRDLLKLRLTHEVPTLHPAWGPELRRRLADIQTGKAILIPMDDVLEDMDRLQADLEAKYGST